MAEQRLIDANNLGVGKANPGIFVCKEYAHGWNNALQAVVEAAPTIDPEALPIVRQLRAELDRVTAERDAAEKDRAELADFELCVCEQFCFGDRERNIPPCEWRVSGKCKLQEWRGWQKEAHP